MQSNFGRGWLAVVSAWMLLCAGCFTPTHLDRLSKTVELNEAYVVNRDNTISVAGVYQTRRNSGYLVTMPYDELVVGELTDSYKGARYSAMNQAHIAAAALVSDEDRTRVREISRPLVARNKHTSTWQVYQLFRPQSWSNLVKDGPNSWKLGSTAFSARSIGRGPATNPSTTQTGEVVRGLNVFGYASADKDDSEFLIASDGTSILLLPAKVRREDAPGWLTSTLVIVTTPVAAVFDIVGGVLLTGTVVGGFLLLAPVLLWTTAGFLLFGGGEEFYGKMFNGVFDQHDWPRPVPRE